MNVSTLLSNACNIKRVVVSDTTRNIYEEYRTDELPTKIALSHLIMFECISKTKIKVYV